MDWTQPSRVGWADVPAQTTYTVGWTQPSRVGWTQPSRVGWADVQA